MKDFSGLHGDPFEIVVGPIRERENLAGNGNERFRVVVRMDGDDDAWWHCANHQAWSVVLRRLGDVLNRGTENSAGVEIGASHQMCSLEMFSSTSTMDCYVVLGIAEDADGETIRSAFRALARRSHPT